MSVSRKYIDDFKCCPYEKYKSDPKDHIEDPGYERPINGGEDQIGAEQYMGKTLIRWRLKKLNDMLHSVDKVGVPLAKYEYQDCLTKCVHTVKQCKATLDGSVKRLDYEREKIKSRKNAMKLADKYRFI